jgi:hypothetical protein
VCLQDDVDHEIGVPASPNIIREAGLQVGLPEDYYSCTARGTLHGSEHVYLPNRVVVLCRPCAPR